MSLFGVERSSTNPVDIYDHAINLVDSTKPKTSIELASEDPSLSSSLSEIPTEQPATRQVTKGHLRKELARRKYAKWQERKEADASAEDSNVEENGAEPNSKKLVKSDTLLSDQLRDKIPFRTKKKPTKPTHDQETFIEVLYENQRGWWLCGIPLYSSNSLLQFDPAGWQTSRFEDSPVNITNAQVPDPNWQWAWRMWYVDMSYDVDEEGWQYSFSFGKQFAWHGNHPWFHSYARRRRWLRKRVKKESLQGSNKKGNMQDGHRLTADYFTIHPSGRDRSRGSSNERGTHRSSFTDAYMTASETDEDIQDIGDIAALLAALKRSIVDREKITALRTFVDQGGDELYYLGETIPTVLDDLIHQSSRRQAQHVLLQALNSATKASKKDEGDEDQRNANKRRVDNLLKAIHVAGVHENDADYWSDLRLQATQDEVGPTEERNDLDSTEAPDPTQGAPPTPKAEDDDENFKEEIKGLSNDALKEPHIGDAGATEGEDNEETNPAKRVDKGKGRA